MGIMSRINHQTGKAIHKYNMIEEGDNILVGFSAGKDSYALLDILKNLKRKSPVNFDFTAVIIDAGFNMDYSPAIVWLEKNKIPYIHKITKIREVIEKEMETANPCFICSRLRRGIIYDIAKKKGFNKVALGHHLDDAMETLLLNIMYSSKLEPLKPIYTSDDGAHIVIRPMIEVRESDLIKLRDEKNYPIVKQDCILKKGESKREMIREILRNISKENKFLHSSMKNSMEELFELKNKNKK